jgi:hypothetical protein
MATSKAYVLALFFPYSAELRVHSPPYLSHPPEPPSSLTSELLQSRSPRSGTSRPGMTHGGSHQKYCTRHCGLKSRTGRDFRPSYEVNVLQVGWVHKPNSSSHPTVLDVHTRSSLCLHPAQVRHDRRHSGREAAAPIDGTEPPAHRLPVGANPGVLGPEISGPAFVPTASSTQVPANRPFWFVQLRLT